MTPTTDDSHRSIDVSMPPGLRDEILDTIDYNVWSNTSQWMRAAAVLALDLEQDPHHDGLLAQVDPPADDERVDDIRELQARHVDGDAGGADEAAASATE